MTVQHVGVTGTQDGMTAAQFQTFRLEALRVERLVRDAGDELAFHHGDCVGVDAQAASLVWTEGRPGFMIAHPCDIESKRARTSFNTDVREVKRPMDRNDDIVAEVGLLFVIPSGCREEQRSGTWATARRGRKAGRRLCFIWPDGTMTFGWPA